MNTQLPPSCLTKWGRLWRASRGWLRRLVLLPLVGLIRFYQYGISPFIAKSCRFIPSCSEYAIEALYKHGPLKGLYLTLRRILRCHPWGGSGYDPVP
ncbi:MAG: membrane protein insertion efficiency factor YidD [Bacteroidales bacterium]|nr:membrane protein insertion efficiency factor YidD [Bacteroidales bacterium]